MRHDDYVDIHSGAYIMADELDRKRAAAAARIRPFEPVTLSGYIQLTWHFIASYSIQLTPPNLASQLGERQPFPLAARCGLGF